MSKRNRVFAGANPQDSKLKVQMQVLQAGGEKYILLELETEALGGIASQAGFDLNLEETDRAWIVDLTAQERQSPLLLFDASDPGNLGWFSRCQFYVDG